MLKKILIIFLTFSLIACQSDSKEEEKPAKLNEIDSKFSFEKIWTKNLFSEIKFIIQIPLKVSKIIFL